MKTEKKEKTIEVLDVMIQHADKGPSGFWVDDYEGVAILKYSLNLRMD